MLKQHRHMVLLQI